MTQQPHIQQALAEYCNSLKAHIPEQLEQLILYGSQARGDAGPESDIDILVVVNWEAKKLANGFYVVPVTDSRWQFIVDLASDISMDYGVYISPFVVGLQRFQTWAPLFEQVRSEGIEIWKKKKH